MSAGQPDAVVKVGGSLFDLPDLGPRLHRYLERTGWQHVLLVPGGGPAADAVRRLDRCHQLGEEAAHWLALEAMALNARFLATILMREEREPCRTALQSRLGREFARPDGSGEPSYGLDSERWSVLDALRFAQADDGNPDCLPHSWAVTSDSVAARAAVVGAVGRLVLLKSISIPTDLSWTEASQRGWVDEFFPLVLRAAPHLEVSAVNLRTWAE
jgi:aspartokinase-like uncharacterized kinase